MEIAFFVGFFILVAVLAYVGYLQEKKRKAGLDALMQRLGLSISYGQNSMLARELLFLNQLNQGSNRYAFDVVSGVYRGEQVRVFSYHYETYSTDSKGRRQTHHHYMNVHTVGLPRAVPELTIAKEGFFSKVAQAFGYDDIDFESHEFSRTFCVRSKDRKFAYDICHALAMDYLLANRDLAVELERDVLAFVFSGKLQPESLAMNLDRLLHFRGLMPEYLWK